MDVETYFLDRPSDLYITAVAALRELLVAEGEDHVNRAFADAVAVARQKRFVDVKGVTEGGDGHACVYRLTGKDCPKEPSHRDLPAGEHVTEWVKDGQTVSITSHPYGISYEELKQIVEFCERYGLEAFIDARTAWRFPGWALKVEYLDVAKLQQARADFHRQLQQEREERRRQVGLE